MLLACRHGRAVLWLPRWRVAWSFRWSPGIGMLGTPLLAALLVAGAACHPPAKTNTLIYDHGVARLDRSARTAVMVHEEDLVALARADARLLGRYRFENYETFVGRPGGGDASDAEWREISRGRVKSAFRAAMLGATHLVLYNVDNARIPLLDGGSKFDLRLRYQWLAFYVPESRWPLLPAALRPNPYEPGSLGTETYDRVMLKPKRR